MKKERSRARHRRAGKDVRRRERSHFGGAA
jgi:hypothetical protein